MEGVGEGWLVVEGKGGCDPQVCHSEGRQVTAGPPRQLPAGLMSNLPL